MGTAMAMVLVHMDMAMGTVLVMDMVLDMVMDMVMVMVDIITGRDPLVILMHLKTMLYLKDQLMLGMAMGMAMVTAIAMDMDMVMVLVVLVTVMDMVIMVGYMVIIMEVIIRNQHSLVWNMLRYFNICCLVLL